jgi:hypothetical protein
MIGFLLREQSGNTRQWLGKVRREFWLVGDLAADVARDAAKKGLQPLDLAPRPSHLPRVRVAVRQAQARLPRR